VTIPELGTLRAEHPPVVILTSNRSRELSDALRRRCLYLWLDYPEPGEERAILEARVPGVGERLATQIARVMAVLRDLPMTKAPGVAESIDWATALVALHRDALDPATLDLAWSCVIKVRDDRAVAERARTTLEAALDGQTAPGVEMGGHGLGTDFGFGTVTVRE
jgi:MoxR-like ATPase